MCLNKLCKTPQSRVQEHASYCDKCEYLRANPTWFPNTVVAVNTCQGDICDEPITKDKSLCSSCDQYHAMINDPNFCEMCMDDVQFCPHYKGN